MQTALFSRTPFVVTALFSTGLIVSGCSITPPPRSTSSQPAVVEETSPAESTVTATPLEQQSAATSPWDYIALARNATGVERQTYTLDAIEGFLDLGQSSTARTLLEQLQGEPLPQALRVRRQLLLARSFFQTKQYARVETLLQPLAATPGLDAETAGRIMLLRARALAASGNAQSALGLLTAREPLLQNPAAVTENQETIWQLLALLDTNELSALRNDNSRLLLAQWADLALISQRFGWNPHELRQQFERWRQLYPSHPASRVLIPETLAKLGSEMTRYRKIALLLPLTSGFGTAAQAVYDGFTMIYENDSSPFKPEVTLYDTGENAELIGFYYQAAVRDGAELVIGPLGKSAVDALVATTEFSVPTLMLGNSDIDNPAGGNVYQFGLSPEDEANRVARKAFDDGHRVAAILYPETDWGIRQLDAFAQQFENLGGTIAESSIYQVNAQDHSQTVKLMLNLDESEARHREIQRAIGVPLEFVPKRRGDIDFIFMIARSAQGRLLKPQINFFKGQDLPVYAISQIYGGGGNEVADIDLDGVIFGDMPWLLLDSGVYRAVRENLPQADMYRDDPLDRLFALGMDSYQLLFRLEAMKANPQLEFRGNTGQLSLAPDGTITRRLEWARFAEGKPIPLGWNATLAADGGNSPR
jgi:outer membrane PBP1 activator LpoA protein